MTHADDTSDREPETDADDAETTRQPVVETVEADTSDPVAQPSSPVPHAGNSTGIDRRAAGFGAGAVAVLVLVFVAGLMIGSDRDDDRARGSFAAARGGGQAGPGGPGGHMQRGQGMQGKGGSGARGMQGRGMQGKGMQGRGMQGQGMQGQGMRGQGMQGKGMQGRGTGHRGGGMGVVTSVSDDRLEVESLRGGEDATFTVVLDDDTKVFTRGDAGPRDLEEADVDDIGEGDIVMVRGGERHEDADDAESDDRAAKAVMIVRAADE